MTIFLKNTTYIDSETLSFKKGIIKVEDGLDGKISFVDKIADEKSADRIIDCTGKLVTKSFGCAHHHAYSALARGMNPPRENPENFYEVLNYIWWNLDKSLDPEIIRASALSTAIFCAKNGVTFVIDHHASPYSIDNSLSIIAESFEKIGISHLLCYEISDRDGFDIAERGLQETEEYLKKNQGLVGLHAGFTVGEKTMRKAALLAEKYETGIHIHTAEDALDQEISEKDYGKRLIERFLDYGFLENSKTILAHCLHLDENERNILATSKCWIAENVESNMNNNVGFFSGKNLSRVMLGTDGMHSDMLRSAKSAFLVGNVFESLTISDTYSRFRNIHKYLSVSKFSGDSENNLVILDYNSPTEVNENNFLAHFLYGIDSSHVESVISNGRLIVEKRTLLTADESEILLFSREMGRKLWDIMSRRQ